MDKKRKTMTMDGNMAAAHVSYAFTEAAAVYPITPSTPMAEYTEKWSSKGKENAFGHAPVIRQMQSEAGAAGALHGILQAGALGTTYTASQGLLLMVPNLYKMAGELLPAVIHVAARALATHALSIFCDHSDIYACRQTGCGILCASNVQEVMDLGAVAHMAAIVGRVPFIHFFDGFRTSHEIQKIEVWEEETLREFLPQKQVDEFRARALNPEHPVQRGTAQNPDIFFQTREAANGYYEKLPEIVTEAMEKVNKKAGTNYHLFDYYGDREATHVIVAMGSVCDTIKETVDEMRREGKKVGLLQVRLFRPFSKQHLWAALPKTVKQISVLDRSKEPGAVGEALYLDVVAALKESPFASVPVFGGRYGLGSKDVTPANIVSVYQNTEKKEFTIGIEDDVTHLSLSPMSISLKNSSICCKFWGMGADGTVGAAKNSIHIIGENTPSYVQAYFEYDSRKSGGVTISHLRFGEAPIRSAYRIYEADFVACHMPAYLERYDMVQDLKQGGVFLLNCPWKEEELEEKLPGRVKRFLAEKEIQFYVIDGFALGKKIGLGGRINTILQAAFFTISGILPKEEAEKLLKEAVKKTYEKKGQAVVEMNEKAIEEGMSGVRQISIPEKWKNSEEKKVSGETKQTSSFMEYVQIIQKKIQKQKGDQLPVSAFVPYADGTTPVGTTAFEKRGVGIESPRWNPDGCIQCNACAFVCPHACIRPLVVREEEREKVPEGIMTEFRGMNGYQFAVTISTLDCTGCGNCAHICPGNKKNDVLKMIPAREAMEWQKMYDYGVKHPVPHEVCDKFPPSTMKGSQFRQPLLEYSGACAGCGETAYAKLVTQLFGDRLYIANATGCSSIWGGSSPSCAYTVNSEGKGPAWANSLFEDNAEFGYGMRIAQKTLRNRVLEAVSQCREEISDNEEEKLLTNYLDTREDGMANQKATKEMMDYLAKKEEKNKYERLILQLKDFASRKSHWIFGGDGWAYDIGYGGLDHVLASGENVNILVFDTEVYSNTGGQVSKATPMGAVAQLASRGKEKAKKDLAAMAICYGDVYVAQVSQGADYNQMIKAFMEAEQYPGPSLIIAYAPCINHGIRSGMGSAVEEEKRAVLSGYWQLFRYQPLRKKKGENPWIWDSREPSMEMQEFFDGELRFDYLQKTDPGRAKMLLSEAEHQVREKVEMRKEISLQ